MVDVERLHKARVPQKTGRLPKKKKTLAERVPKGATLRRQKVRCGKVTCAKLHGPYWYAAWKEDGKTRTAYIGTDAKMSAFLKERSDLVMVHARAVAEESFWKRTGRR